MTNSQIADHFSLLSKLMDIHGDNSFKAKSYGVTAYNIEKLPAEISTMGEIQFFSMKGIGESTGKKILELQATGKLAALEDVLAKTPPGILEMLEIKGLGPKKIAVIWKELGIESVGELEYACNENRLVALKGFGAKTQDSILQSIAYIRQNEGFYLWSEAAGIAKILLERLQQAFPANRFEYTGALRRQAEVMDAIDMLTDAGRNELSESLSGFEGVAITEEDADTLMVAIPGQPKLRFYLSEPAQFYKKLFATTGSDEFRQAFGSDLPDAPASEDEIFAARGIPYIHPAMRETATVIEKAKNGQIAHLIQPEDIRGIIHSHSTWSDGMNTIEEMAVAARGLGLEYLVMSDHSQAAFYANGLTPERIAAQHAEIDALNIKLAPFKIFKSIEADILNDGSLDYTDQVLSTFDLVIASVHSNLKMSEEKAMSRVMTAIANPYTAILGHPTGRLLLSRKGYPLDHKAIIDACAANKVVIEINAHPRRLDLDWRWIDYAMDKGVLLSIDPDAHSVEGYNSNFYGVMIAQKGGLTANRNLSSFTLVQFEAYLQQYRQKRS